MTSVIWLFSNGSLIIVSLSEAFTQFKLIKTNKTNTTKSSFDLILIPPKYKLNYIKLNIYYFPFVQEILKLLTKNSKKEYEKND